MAINSVNNSLFTCLYNKLNVFFIIFISAFIFGGNLFAQTDTEFWFSIPETNRYHNVPNSVGCAQANDGKRVYFKFTSMELESTITISYPATGAVITSFTMPANSFQSIDVGAWVNNSPTTIENRLRYSTSDAQSINRSKKGILIKATTPVTVYYEISLPYNKDLLSLKGRNALGQLFFVPFQNRFETSAGYVCDQQQYSSFDIVATEDNTLIEITVPHRVFVWNRTPNFNNAGTFNITLNKGETAIITPYDGSKANNYKTHNANKLTGSMVKVISGGNIAVITKDDLVKSVSSVDYVADQLVPIDHIGNDYAIVRGYLTTRDYAYVVATEDNTGIYVDGVLAATKNRGETYEVQLNNIITTIKSSIDKPVYVYHLSGYGAQFSGALIPTISTCTGSSQVAFNRSTTTYDGLAFGFNLNFIVRNKSIGNFKLYKDGVDVTATDGATLGINDPANFHPVPGTYVDGTNYSDDWSYAQFDAGIFQVGSAYLLKNTKDVFHLGIMNGASGADAFYGYFSNFNTFDPKSFVVATGFGGEKVCTGQTRQLYATGGTTYSWSPPDFLNDHEIANPIAGPLLNDITYEVTIGGACDLTGTSKVVFRVGSADPSFNADTWSACAKPATLGADPSHAFTFTSNSVGDYVRTWRYRKVGDVVWTQFAHGTNIDANPATVVNLTLFNNTDNFIEYELNLAVSDFEVNCTRNLTKIVRVYPYMDIDPTVIPSVGCQPLPVQFTANPNPAGFYTGATYLWEFGDGGSDNVQNPTHIYYNDQPPYNPLPYVAEVTLKDQWGVCSVTKPVNVTVHPLVEPKFTANQIEGCSPLDATITNVSRGGITYWAWYVNGTLSSSTNVPPDFSNLVNGRTDNQPEDYVLRLVVRNSYGCEAEFSRTIRVFPQPSAVTTVAPQPNVNCSPLLVNFNAINIINSDAYSWTLDNIPITSSATASYTLENYTAATQSHSFAFTINNNWGCSFKSVPVNVDVHPFVDAKIIIDDEEGCSPHTTLITNGSSIGTTQWDWTIIDGATTHTHNTHDIPGYTFSYPAAKNNTYVPHDVTVQLTTRNAVGCERTDTKTIRINPTATASFSALITNFEGTVINPATDMLCSPVYADFYGTYVNAENYNWQFGTFGGSLDPSPANIEMSNTGTLPKNVNVTLQATNRFGCSAPLVTENYTIQPKITAAFSMVSDGSCVPVIIDVDAQAVTGATYSWTQNGAAWGSFKTGQITINQNHSGVDQVVTISLRVDNGSCYDVSPELAVLVHPEVEAKWSLGNALNPGCSPYSLAINNLSTLHSVATPVNQTTGYVNWAVTDAGGNSITTGADDNFTRLLQNDSHLTSKVFDVTLTATSSDGCSHSKTAPVEIYPKVTPAFNIDIIDICTPLELGITDASLTTLAGSTYTWAWDGGVVTSLGGQDYGVIYNNPDPNNVQNKIITLSLSNSYGCLGSFDYLFNVLPQVNSSFALAAGSQNFHCGAGDVTFQNSSTGGSLNYFWDFNDGEHISIPTTASVTHSFNNGTKDDAVYNVSLVAENLYSCTDKVIIPITIHPKVEADFSFTIPDLCAYPLQVDFVNNSVFGNATATNSTVFNWDYGYVWGAVPQADARPNSASHSYSFYNDLPDGTRTYTIALNPQQTHTISGLTCQDNLTRTITVNPELIADFNLVNTEGCNPLTVQFNNNSRGIMAAGGGYYQWDFGDNTSGTSASPSNKVYTHSDKTQAITYPVNLVVTNPIGCKKSDTHNVVVYPWVESAFSLDKFKGCTPLEVEVTNLSTSPAYAYQWAFTGGTPANSTAAQPGTITFVNTLAPPSTLDVLHPVLNLQTGLNTALYPVGGGCAKTDQIQVDVFPHVYPSFTGSLTGCQPLDVVFTNSSGVYGGTANGQYVWDFGNGVVSNNINNSQTYFNPSLTADYSYFGELKAISEHGCEDSTPFEVVVHPKPQSRMEMISDYMSCSPFDVEIQNLSIGKGINTTLEFVYDFGDGNVSPVSTSTDNMLHQYHNYNSTIEAYMITLFVETEDGCVDESYQTIHAYPEVTAQFAFDPGDAACNPFTVKHLNSSNNSWYYEWDFDDTFNSYLHSPTHEFQNFTEIDRVFNVKLTALSEYDCVGVYTLPLTVYAAPKVDFAIDPPSKVFPDATFEFVNQTYPAADTWDYTWTYGDGYGSTEKQPLEHTYSTWGPIANDFKYPVYLKVANTHCSGEMLHYVTLRPPQPISQFDANEFEACSPLEVYFENNSLYGHSYEWDFGDGTTSTEFEPFHVYETPGYYNVGLKVTGDGGIKQYHGVFQVFENPIAKFLVKPQEVNLPDALVRVFNLSEMASTYIWDLGDGTILTTKDVVHTYSEVGEYRIHLTAISDKSCVDTTSVYPAVWVRGPGKIRFPNAFVPSKLGPNGGNYDIDSHNNEIFHPVYQSVAEYKLLIFNRWGEQIFESNDLKIGWDGYYKGKLSSQDVYVFRAVGMFFNGKMFDVRGNVTLLR